jgi:hypothetical protein
LQHHFSSATVCLGLALHFIRRDMIASWQKKLMPGSMARYSSKNHGFAIEFELHLHYLQE